MVPKGNEELIDSNGQTLKKRFSPPLGFQRKPLPKGSFAAFLRSLPLQEAGSPVELYDGRTKGAPAVRAAVVDLPIGNKDLHQCADAAIHLRAEFLYRKKAYDRIAFHFTNGFLADFSKWRKGHRIMVEGGRTFWTAPQKDTGGAGSFREYLETVYTYAGTISLSRELRAVPLDSMKIGDLFIQGGSPGHAVIVVDMARDPHSGKKCFLLAQSFMPAQEIHILENPNDPDISPWYTLDPEKGLKTPEWKFTKRDLKSWPSKENGY
ncbi:MAG: DUF4846 domain-containing protein [Flavobacteriales bacterium]